MSYNPSGQHADTEGISRIIDTLKSDVEGGGETGKIDYISYFPNNIKKRPLHNIWYLFRQSFAMAKHDMVMIGGGGIFFDNEPGITFSKIIFEWKLRLFFARLFARKIVFFGISFEVKNRENYAKLATLFRHTDTICVRDFGSQAILQKIGISSVLFYDSVFLLPPQKRVSYSRQVKRVGIALRGGFLSKNDIRALVECVEILKKQGMDIVFLSHSFVGSETHNDVEFVRTHFGDSFQITQTMEETLLAYQSIDAVIAMRLHSAILASMYALPMIIIPYGPKVYALSEMLGLSEHTIDTKNINSASLQQYFSVLCSNYQAIQAKIGASYEAIHTNFLKKIKKNDIL